MAMQKIYKRINWENLPSEKTPLDQNNLNNMDKGIDDLDDRIIEIDQRVALVEGGGASSGSLVIDKIPIDNTSVIDVENLSISFSPSSGDAGNLIVKANDKTVHKQNIIKGDNELELRNILSPGDQDVQIFAYDNLGACYLRSFNVKLLDATLNIYKDGVVGPGLSFVKAEYVYAGGLTAHSNNELEKYYNYKFTGTTPYGGLGVLKSGPYNLKNHFYKRIRAKFKATIGGFRSFGFGVFNGDVRPSGWQEPNMSNALWSKMVQGQGASYNVEDEYIIDISNIQSDKRGNVYVAFWLGQGNNSETSLLPDLKIYELVIDDGAA